MTMTTWNEFLHQQQANIEGNSIRFADTDVELLALGQSQIICPLIHLGVIKVSGDDAQDFMQNQFTNDLRLTSVEQGQYNAYCSPKGRMLANFWLINNGDHFFLILARELMEASLKRLRMYVLMSKVVLEDMTDSMPALGMAGEHLDATLQNLGISLPSGDLQHSVQGETHCLRLPGPLSRVLIIAPKSQAETLFDKFDGTRVGNGVWRLLDIRSGIPMIYGETVEAFVPQMANLQLINGVSFKKGCYPGQEIVARMQYLGSLKRRMYHARVKVEQLPAVGSSLFATGSESGQGAGKVVDAQWAGPGVVELLAVAEIKSAEGDHLHLDSVEGPELDLLDLPYPIEAQAS